MNNLNKYNDFLFEELLNVIIFKINEDEEPVTFEWDLTKDKSKLKKILGKLPKEKILLYLSKFLNKIKILPLKTRKKLILINCGLYVIKDLT